MRKGFSKYSWKTDEEKEYICKLIERGHTDQEISDKVYWPVTEVRDVRVELFPTCGLAKYYLKSQALKLAKRVVEEGNVAESVDVLSRPNIGVLAPAVKNQPGPMKASFLTSINPADLGGVKVAAQISTGVAVEQSGTEQIESDVEPELRVPTSIREKEEQGCRTSPYKARPARTRRSQGPQKSIPPLEVTPSAPES